MAIKKEVPMVEVPAHQFRWGHGFELRDTISGFTGYVVYRVDNITGCDNYGIQPESTDSTEMSDVKLIDSSRLEFTGKVKGLPVSKVVEKPGGIKSIPQRKIK